MKTGLGVQIHRTVQLFGNDIEIGDNVRIDAFSILTGKIRIGSHIHIAAGAYLYGGAGIVMEDFGQFAPRLLVMSTSDDFSGESMIGPCIHDKYKPGLKKEPVFIGRHVVTGACTTIMPGVTIGEGVSLGAHSLVMKDLEPWMIYVGSPVRKIKERSRKIEELEREYLKEWNSRINS